MSEVKSLLNMSFLHEINNEIADCLPTEDLLEKWSFVTSIGKSTNKLTVTERVIQFVEADSQTYKAVLECDDVLQGYLYRVKTPDSIRRKVQRHPDLKFQSVFNDILGIRIRVPDYELQFPEYYRVVDMQKGKAVDDGYRAVHLYYKKDNFHYPIEVQLWSDRDYNFNLWSHTYGYKILSNEVLKAVRDKYEMGEIKTYNDYLREVRSLCQ